MATGEMHHAIPAPFRLSAQREALSETEREFGAELPFVFRFLANPSLSTYHPERRMRRSSAFAAKDLVSPVRRQGRLGHGNRRQKQALLNASAMMRNSTKVWYARLNLHEPTVRLHSASASFA